MPKKKRIRYADDDTESVGLLLRLRLPPLAIGLLLGLVLSFVTSGFEEVLSENVSVAFFIPFIVYLADAVGTQTQNIYSRDLRSGKASFHRYLIKESILGILFGLLFGVITATIVTLWFQSTSLALAISLSVFGATATAPLISLIVTEFFQLEHLDPAVGSGPLATIILDTISVIIYGLIASAILL